MTNSQNEFTRYTLTPEEEMQGQILTPLQEKAIQNVIAGYAEELVRVSYTRTDPDFFNKISTCQGQIMALKSLLTTSRYIVENLTTASSGTDGNS